MNKLSYSLIGMILILTCISSVTAHILPQDLDHSAKNQAASTAPFDGMEKEPDEDGFVLPGSVEPVGSVGRFPVRIFRIAFGLPGFIAPLLPPPKFPKFL
jgi:hypothetical protein